MSILNEGSMTFWLRHEHKDWTSNSNTYSFGEIEHSGIIAGSIKKPDRTVEIKLSGALGRDFTFRQSIPTCDERGLSVAFTWTDKEINLYLNGRLVETISRAIPDNSSSTD